MNIRCEGKVLLKESIFEVFMIVSALLSGGIFACYHLKFGRLPVEEIRDYFLLKNQGITWREFGFVFIDYAKLAAIMIFFNAFDYLKYVGKIFIIGVLFGYGYIMTTLYASMRLQECLLFIVVLAMQGGLLASFMIGLSKSKKRAYEGQRVNILMENGVKGTAVCLCLTMLNLISRINIMK